MKLSHVRQCEIDALHSHTLWNNIWFSLLTTIRQFRQFLKSREKKKFFFSLHRFAERVQVKEISREIHEKERKAINNKSHKRINGRTPTNLEAFSVKQLLLSQVLLNIWFAFALFLFSKEK